jgi:hypothetical protein
MLASHERASRFIEDPALNVVARQSGDGKSLIGQTIAHYQVLALLARFLSKAVGRFAG